MNCNDKVRTVLSSTNLVAVVDRIRRECDAVAAALLSCTAEGIAVVAAAPRHNDAADWQDCVADCRTVVETGLPLERRGPSRDGEPASLIICPVDGAGAIGGVIAIRRHQPFLSEDVDFVRLLGIELGAAADSLMAQNDEGVRRLRVAGE